MTGFDETVPPDDDPTRDENSAGPDAPGGETQPKPDVDVQQDDELRSGQFGTPADG